MDIDWAFVQARDRDAADHLDAVLAADEDELVGKHSWSNSEPPMPRQSAVYVAADTPALNGGPPKSIDAALLRRSRPALARAGLVTGRHDRPVSA